MELSIPVNLPATTEAFATYGVTSDSVSQTVLPPKDALRNFGGLRRKPPPVRRIPWT